MRHLHWLLLLLAACNPLARRAAPPPPGPAEAAPEEASPLAVSQPAAPDDDDGWIDPNVLPQGATARFGDARFIGNAPVGLLSDGRVVSARGDADVVVWRPDGTMKSIAAEARFTVTDDDHIVTAGARKVRVFSPEGQELSTFDAPQCELNTITFSADGKSLACGRGEVVVYGVASGEARLKLHGEGLYTRPGGLALSNGLLAYLRGNDADLHIIDIESGKSVRVHKGTGIDAIAMSRDGEILYVEQSIRELAAYETRSGRQLWRHAPSDANAPGFPLVESRDGSLLAASLYDGEYRAAIVDVENGHVRAFPEIYAHGFAFSGDGSRLAAAGGGNVVVFDVQTGRERLGPTTRFESLTASAVRGDRVAAVSKEGMLSIWNRSTAERLVHEHLSAEDVEPSFVEDLLFVDDDRVLTVSRYDGVFITDVVTGRVTCHTSLGGHQVIPLGSERFAALDRGSAPDDWPFGGELQIFDTSCNVVKTASWSGFIADAELLDGVLRLWISNGGQNTEPTEMWAEDFVLGSWAQRTVKDSRKPLADWDPTGASDYGIEDRPYGFKALPLREGKTLELGSGPDFIPSVDGKLLVILDFVQEENEYRALVVDLEARELLHEFEMPDAFTSAVIDDSSSLLTVTDGGTVLLYPLR